MMKKLSEKYIDEDTKLVVEYSGGSVSITDQIGRKKEFIFIGSKLSTVKLIGEFLIRVSTFLTEIEADKK